VSPIVLASKSPRRRELLELIGLPFTIEPADIDESIPAGMLARDVVTTLARAKAERVAARGDSPRTVLSADTLVVVDLPDGSERVLGQPSSDEQALEMMRLLSGKEHRILTGFALISREPKFERVRCIESVVRFRKIREDELLAYVASGEGRDKAGAYGAQGLAAIFIEEIRGSFTNIVGLPLAEVVDELQACGLWTPEMVHERSRRSS